jgi:hypothetical protein
MRRVMLRRSLAVAAFVAVAWASAGCTAEVGPGPVYVDGYEAYYVDTIPPDIEVYPHYAFDGGYAYYAEGRWYHRRAGRWYVFRHPPQVLVRERERELRRP